MLNSPIPVTAALALFGLLILIINEARGVVQLRQKLSSVGPFSISAALIATGLLVIGIAGAAAASKTASYSTALTGGLFGMGGAVPRTNSGNMLTAFLTMPPILIAGGGLVVLLSAFFLYRYEMRQPGFHLDHSAGVLNMAVGSFTLIAALLIPAITSQLNSTAAAASAGRTDRLNVAVMAVNSTPTVFGSVILPTAQPTATPTVPAASANMATPLPTLTATLSETPLILYTVIPYTSTYAVGLTVLCTVTTTGQVNLRADPSMNQQAIGSVYGGSLLNALGHTADGKWWHVVSIQGGVTVEGWVSGDFITPDSYCSAVPVVDNTGSIVSKTSTPAPMTPTDAVKAATTAFATSPCVLMTDMAASLRPEPSTIHNALAGVPNKTAFVPIGKSADGAWWQVTYQDKTGWIIADAVVASSACTQILAPTMTPVATQH